MQKYKCHKIVEASQVLAVRDLTLILGDFGDESVDVTLSWLERHRPYAGGYYVKYEDGYTSFSPADTFKEGYALLKPESTTGLSFGAALGALEDGKRVSRAGWNGKGMFLFLLPAANGLPTTIIHDPALRQVVESEVGGDTFDALPSIRMFTADKKILTGWNASQADLFAKDWQILSE